MTKFYRITEFSKLTAITVRTLHYYEEINLLKPSHKSASGHRVYSEESLLRLQQITTLKYMGFSLTKIKVMLEQADFDIKGSLTSQAAVLAAEAQRIKQVAALLDYLAGQRELSCTINWQSMVNIIEVLERSKINMQTLTPSQGNITASELGKTSKYSKTYHPDILFSLPRQNKRSEIGVVAENIPFFGFDYWNHYEVSWLNEKGKPIVALAEMVYDCHTPNIVESKSLKLYFNSFNNTCFQDQYVVEAAVKKDLEARIGGEVHVKITPLSQHTDEIVHFAMSGECLDDLDIACTSDTVDPHLLTTQAQTVEETLYSNLLKSNCLVTNQPDWGTIEIHYRGKQINREGLLSYIVSFRQHNEFHEQCIERIFVDIMRHCQPTELTVYGRYTRRGGLDINPYRSTHRVDFQGKNQRLIRQ